MTGLEANAVTKRFGGLTALDGVSLALRRGEVHGLIGPNGSGKTTLLNLLSGFYQADQGQVMLDGEDVTRASVQRRAAGGVARTFQKPRLLGTLSVLDNAVLGGWRERPRRLLPSMFALPGVRAEERRNRDRAAELLHGLGLGYALHRRANLLEHAEKRFLEIARALMLRPDYILLDEPAGGLTGVEIERLGTVVRTLRETGIGVLLVEHHTEFVFGHCDRVSTFHLGRLLRHGTPQEVRNDPEVIRVYLGA
jgi:ABC-type branched-subunit amino acid transport system ATPase component